MTSSPIPQPQRFDWRFLLCMIVLAMVGYLIFVGVTAVQDGRAKDHRIDALIVSLERERADAQSERLAAAHERHRAALEREKVLRGQESLLRKYEALLQRQSALNAYLRAHGIDIPANFDRTTVLHRAATHSTRHSTHSTRHTTKHSAVSSAPKGPGRSGAHRRFRRHHRRH